MIDRDRILVEATRTRRQRLLSAELELVLSSSFSSNNPLHALRSQCAYALGKRAAIAESVDEISEVLRCSNIEFVRCLKELIPVPDRCSAILEVFEEDPFQDE